MCWTSVSTLPCQQREDKRQRLKPGPRPAVKPRLLPARSFGTSTTPVTFFYILTATICFLFIGFQKDCRCHVQNEMTKSWILPGTWDVLPNPRSIANWIGFSKVHCDTYTNVTSWKSITKLWSRGQETQTAKQPHRLRCVYFLCKRLLRWTLWLSPTLCTHANDVF